MALELPVLPKEQPRSGSLDVGKEKVEMYFVCIYCRDIIEVLEKNELGGAARVENESETPDSIDGQKEVHDNG